MREKAHAEEQRIWDHEFNDAFIVRPDGNRWRAASAADQLGMVPSQFSSSSRDKDGGGLAYFGATARQAVERLEQGKGRKLHPYSYIDREAVEHDVAIELPPAVIESAAEAEEWLRSTPKAYTENSGALTRDEYWKIVARSAPLLEQRPKWIVAGELADAGLTTVDILRYTDGLADVNIHAMSQPKSLHSSELPRLLTAIAEDALGHDLENLKRIGHIPSNAVNEAPRLTEDEYWDACHSIVKYTARFSDTAERLEEIRVRVDAHPFMSTQQYRADILGWTHHLQTMPPNIWSALAKDWGHTAPQSVWVAASSCMEADVWRIASSQYGLGYIPNISKLAYTDEVKKLARKMSGMAKPTVFASLRLAATFVGDFYDAIDVLRMSRNPQALDAWFGAGPQPGRVTADGFDMDWPDGPGGRPYDVPEIIVLAARMAASDDARIWLDLHEEPPGERRPLLTVDQYQDEVRQQVRHIGRSGDPAYTFFKVLMTHPLVRALRARDFPYHALDILRNTAHPNALFDAVQIQRRSILNAAAGRAPVPKGDLREDFLLYRFEQNAQMSGAGFPVLLGDMAAASFCADILDDAGVAALGKYQPNEVR